MIRWLRRLFESRESREERVLRLCGCVCWCPGCGDILNDRAEVHHCPNEGLVCYCCECGCVSEWDFNPPAPILVRPRPEEVRP